MSANHFSVGSPVNSPTVGTSLMRWRKVDGEVLARLQAVM
jgi:hypothetical protein